ncbi:hypothetical protein XA68_16716 [Ophiocordyceps unilateralis]|uniref:EF-hand domain-containing protein n=1 Tax=Ophiocordyceps unilateralis TaxID=268505 RepID=A0A2A9P619_OPHUN|nr:hypothetical protein XA68_16716 [Ophiocordyceps unilateralis]
MSTSTAYKPSPLGYGSSPSRSSPFRRPESPASPSPLRHATPTSSPTKTIATPTTGAARLSRLGLGASIQGGPAPRFALAESPMTSSPPRAANPPSPRPAAARFLSNGNTLSQLQPSQVRTLRDGFQILDRDCDGVVNGEDVADMLNQLGLPNGPSDVARFFPPSRPQTMALAAFLNSLAEALTALSPSTELLSALSAFDDDDSGQIDWAELREALLTTAPEPGERALAAADVDRVASGFTGRRAFHRNINTQLGAKKGEVFRYREFVNSVTGSNGGSDGGPQESAED